MNLVSVVAMLPRLAGKRECRSGLLLALALLLAGCGGAGRLGELLRDKPPEEQAQPAPADEAQP